MEDIKYQILSTPILRVLDYLLQNLGREISDGEVTKNVSGVKRAAIHQALTKLNKLGILERRHSGRKCFSALNTTQSWLLPFKIASNLLILAPLVEEMKSVAIKIVLFGSRANGTNRQDSDFDLFVVTMEPDKVRQIANVSHISGQLQILTKTPEEMLEFEAKEPILSKKINEGVVLWET